MRKIQKRTAWFNDIWRNVSYVNRLTTNAHHRCYLCLWIPLFNFPTIAIFQLSISYDIILLQKKHIMNRAFSSGLLVEVAHICCILPESWRVISSRHVGSSSHYGQLTVHTIHEPRFQLYWRNKRLRLAIVTLSGGKSKQPIYDNSSECNMLWLLRTR